MMKLHMKRKKTEVQDTVLWLWLVTVAETSLKMDQALLTLHNQLTEDVRVFYRSDFCYKVKKSEIFVSFSTSKVSMCTKKKKKLKDFKVPTKGQNGKLTARK